jgi:RHS repeat-associated protein
VTNGSEHEVASYQGVSYAYINDERLKTVTSGSNSYQLAYDALGRCVKRTLNGVTIYYIYDGEKPVLEYNTSGAIVGRNLYGKAIDEILMRSDPTVNSGQPFYSQQDHEGSVTHLTNASGAVIEKYKYDAFGAPAIYDGAGNLRSGGTIYNNRFLFTGREYASTFGFYEYRARAYHPTLGRFTSEDPKLFDAGDYNLYRYCHNDPEDMTDPMGLWPVPPAGEAPPPEGSFQREMDHTPNANASTRQYFQALAQQNATMGQTNQVKGTNGNRGLIDKDGNRPSGEHIRSESDAAGKLVNRAFTAQQASGDSPSNRYEHSGYGAQNDRNVHDYIIYGPFRGYKDINENANKSSFRKDDPSPDGYHRVFVVYTHTNPRNDVDRLDRGRFGTMNGAPHVYLVTPPAPGSMFTSPKLIIWP